MREKRSSVKSWGWICRAASAADPLDHFLGLGEGVGVAPAVGHGKAVVQQHDVVGARAAEQVAPLFCSSGWATISTTAATAAIRSSSSNSCLKMIQVRFSSG